MRVPLDALAYWPRSIVQRLVRRGAILAAFLMASLATVACTSERPAPSSTPPHSTPALTPAPPTQTLGHQVGLDLVAARAAHTATTLRDGSVFVAGGCITDGCSQASAETFLLMADGATFVSGPSLAGPRDGQTATFVGDDVVLVGGYSGEGRDPLATIEVFDSSTFQVESAVTMSLGRGGHAAAALGDGTVLIVGGWVRSRMPSATVVIFDPATNTVTEAADLPIVTDGLDAVSLADGRVLVTGGLLDGGVGSNEGFVFDAAAGAWQSVGPMASPRFKHFSVLLADGRVLVMGGTTDDRTLLATTEIFDPHASTFSAGPTMTEERYKMTSGAVVIDSNRVLIAAGGRSVEIVDVRSGEAEVVDSFAGRGSFTTLNAWGAESFIVLGGYDDRITLRRQFLVIAPGDLEAAAE